MRLDRLTFTALGGIAVFLIGTALLLEDGRALFAPVFGMVGGIAAVASAISPIRPVILILRYRTTHGKKRAPRGNG
jgi:energy-converting hydrogenase Eha subunit C